MKLGRLWAAVRFDSGWWRRFAELGCVYGPEWWKRGSPPVIAGIIFAIAHAQREAVLRNQRQVRGRHGWLDERWNAYRVFAALARSLTETMEQWGPRPRPVTFRVEDGELFRNAIAEGRGLLVPTGHFGCWEVSARFVVELGRPVNLVMAPESNPTARAFSHALRTRHGINVIYSGRSVFTGLPIVQALKRGEIVGMQIDPWGPSQGSAEIDFCGRPARFQLGPFVIARLAGAPVVPVFTVRTGIRQYEMRAVGRFDPKTPTDSLAALKATVRAYEQLVRERPGQWLMFEDVWPAVETAPEPDEVADRASGVRRT